MKKISFPMDIDQASEKQIREMMQEKVPLPDNVRTAKANACERVRQMSASAEFERGEKHMGKKSHRGLYGTLGSIAAAAAVFSGVCIANPALASKVPLVGHVFEELGNSLGFSGDYEKYVQPLEEQASGDIVLQETTEADEKNDAVYSKTVDGVTVTLSEMYCNEKALYLSMLIQAEDEFPETFLDLSQKPIICLKDNWKFSYNTEEIPGLEYLDGKMIDDHTYAGVLRIELEETLTWADSEENYKTVELPEQFTVDLSIGQIIGDLPESTAPDMPEDLQAEYDQALKDNGLEPVDEAYETYTEEQKEIEHQLFTQMWNQYNERYPEANQFPNAYENWWFDGAWEFSFDVTVDHSDTVTKTVNADDACDIGEIKVTQTPFEISVDYDYSKGVDYVVTVLDAQGRPLASGFGDSFAVQDRDVSKVTVYVVDYYEYMDELKGYYYQDNYEELAKEKTYQELLDERAVYYEKVVF